jgi:hypothetical protein
LLGGFVSVICSAASEYNLGGLAARSIVFAKADKYGPDKQAKINLAAMAITQGIAMGSGIIAGFIASRLPHPKVLFDDNPNFEHVEFGDDTDVYNVAHQHHVHEIEMKSST